MKKDRLYFLSKDDEYCYSKKHFLDYMKKNGLNTLEIIIAKKVNASSVFFCDEFLEVGLRSDGTCSRHCDFYNPRNGISGICRSYRFVYEPSDKKVILRNNNYNGKKSISNSNK